MPKPSGLGVAARAVPAGIEPAQLPVDAVEVGRILGPWGVKGWFKIQPFSADPQALFSSKRWYLLPPEAHNGRLAQSAFGGCLLLPIREAKDHADGVVACSGEVPDRNAAETLQGARVFVPRTSFPTAAPDEFYWVDLIGLRVVNREGLALGVVKDLMSTGPQSVLVLEDDAPAAPGQAEPAKPVERLIPFVAAYVDQVDLAGKLITVDWQPDY